MAEPSTLRSSSRSDNLVVAVVYTRDVGASLERVWENVYGSSTGGSFVRGMAMPSM